MKILIIILIMFAWTNLFGSDNMLKGLDDTTKFQLNIKLPSRIYLALESHLKYDEFDMLHVYFTDTLYMVIDRQIYKCNPAFALEKLSLTRKIIKNGNYKYKLTRLEEDTYRFSYFGYFNHEKYEVYLDFVENNSQIVFVAIVIMEVEE